MPRRATPVEVERLKALRTALAPEDGLKTAETFAKYLVASAATVGTVGTALKVAGATELVGAGETLFALALAALGISLALAVWALIPQPVAHNPNQILSMENALSQLLAKRRRILTAAGVSFAAALLLAGAAPIASSEHEDERASGITYTLGADRSITATVEVRGGRELSPLTLEALESPVRKQDLTVSSRSFLDADGNGTASAELKPRKSTRKVQLVAQYRGSEGEAQEMRLRVPLSQAKGN